MNHTCNPDDDHVVGGGSCDREAPEYSGRHRFGRDELVVSFHGFVWATMTSRPGDRARAWLDGLDALRALHPPPEDWESRLRA